ncbi:uncharacterized protein LOC120699200 isoform X4 [Panicum virgatum]|uniref:uncharacterized protein LOC120699200 isoform X4 n=1 Tax=Panicum virgatum TaxID=38727 RepID=UPI0019D58B70|nr:uncharacterized protein LOC120699200 isoform X4 [Panicum virgatum]
MAEDSGAILRHISSLKDMLDKVNEEIEQNIERTREIESEIVKHSETEKDYLDKESGLLKEISVAEFELNGLIQVAAAETDLLKVIEGNLEFQKVALNGIRKTLSDKMERFINESKGFQANMVKVSNEDLVILLKEKGLLDDESENLKTKINTIHSSSKEYIAEILDDTGAFEKIFQTGYSLEVCCTAVSLGKPLRVSLQ